MCGYTRDGQWSYCPNCADYRAQTPGSLAAVPGHGPNDEPAGGSDLGRRIVHSFNRYGGYAAPSDAGPARSALQRLVPPSEHDALQAETYQNVRAGAAAAASVVTISPNRALPEAPYQPEGVVPNPLDPAAAHSWPLHVVGLTRQVERLVGVLMDHEEKHEQYFHRNLPTPTAGQVAGTVLDQGHDFRFLAKSLWFDNPGDYVLWIPQIQKYVPGNVYGYILRCYPAVEQVTLIAAGGGGASGYPIVYTATQSVYFQP